MEFIQKLYICNLYMPVVYIKFIFRALRFISFYILLSPFSSPFLVIFFFLPYNERSESNFWSKERMSSDLFAILAISPQLYKKLKKKETKLQSFSSVCHIHSSFWSFGNGLKMLLSRLWMFSGSDGDCMYQCWFSVSILGINLLTTFVNSYGRLINIGKKLTRGRKKKKRVSIIPCI